MKNNIGKPQPIKDQVVGQRQATSSMAYTMQDHNAEKPENSEDQLRSVLERISDAFVALDNKWCYTYMNKKAGEIFNRDPKAIVGKHIWTEFPEGIGQPFYHAYYKALEEQQYIQLEEYYPPYDRWFANHIYPSPEGLTIYFKDITERKIQEEKNRINEVRLMKAQEMGKLGYWELVRDSDTIWGSEKALEIFGFPANSGEIPTTEIAALIPDFDKVRQAAIGLITEGKKYDIELQINPADGSPQKYISAVGEIEKDWFGKPLKIMGVLKDITEQKKAEQDLLQAFKKISNILESISDGFFAVDKNWNIIYWNKEIERSFGKDREAIMSKNLWKVFSGTISDKFQTELHKAMSEGVSLRFEDYYAPTDIWYKLNVYPTADGLCIFFQDITESKRQEKLYILEKEALEFYASQKSTLEELITFLLNGIKNIHPDMLCSVLKVKDGKLYNWSSPHLPELYNEEVEGTEIGIGKGSCGSAAYLKEKVEVTDISSNPYWNEYKDIVNKFDMKACWSYPIIDSNQNLLGTFGIYHTTIRTLKKPEELTIERVRNILVNVIERKLAENEAKAYKSQLELIFNATNDVIFLITVEDKNRFKFIKVNQTFLIATGLTKNQIEGKYAEEVIPESTRSFYISKYQEAIQKGQSISWDETGDLPSGKTTGIATLSPVFDENKTCIYLIGSVHDITERNKSEEEIKRTNEELRCRNEELKEKNIRLEDIAWVQSHKVRAPLARIMGLIDLITNHYTEETNTDELLKYVLDSAKELDVMIMDIVKKTEMV